MSFSDYYEMHVVSDLAGGSNISISEDTTAITVMNVGGSGLFWEPTGGWMYIPAGTPLTIEVDIANNSGNFQVYNQTGKSYLMQHKGMRS